MFEFLNSKLNPMNIRSMALLLLLLGAPSVKARDGDIIGECVTHYYNIVGGDTPVGKPVQAKLNSIVVPAFEYKKKDIVEVLKAFSAQSKLLDPEHVGVQFRLDLSVAPAMKGFPVKRAVTIKQGDPTSLAEALAIVCEVTHLGYRIVDGAVSLEPM